MNKNKILIIVLVVIIIGFVVYILIDKNSMNSEIYNSLKEECFNRCKTISGNDFFNYEYKPINGEEITVKLFGEDTNGMQTMKNKYFKDKQSCINFCIEDRK